MTRLLGIALATCMFLLPHTVRAQTGQQVFDFFLQQAERELQRQQQRQQQRQFQQQQQQENRRLNQEFLALWNACHDNDDVEGCDQALGFQFLNRTDRQRLMDKRQALIEAQAEQQRAGEAEVERARQEELDRQRAEASPFYRAIDQFSAFGSALLAPVATVTRAIGTLPTSTDVTGVLATVLAIALVLALRRRVPTASTDEPPTATANSLAARCRHWLAWLRRKLRRADVRLRLWWQSQSIPVSPAAKTDLAAREATAVQQRDTSAALAAMELALAYIEEVREADRPKADDEAGRKHQLNTLALAVRKLETAQRADPDAVIEGETKDGVSYRLTLAELQAEVLFLEGLTHQVYDTRRAIPALRKSCELNPNDPRAFFVLGLTHAANMNKPGAVAAFEAAVALDPGNITYRKELDRAQSLTGSEIVGYKATRAAERVYDAGITTANVGIRIYNVGVVCWNAFAFAWNVVTFPLRIVLKIAGHK